MTQQCHTYIHKEECFDKHFILENHQFYCSKLNDTRQCIHTMSCVTFYYLMQYAMLVLLIVILEIVAAILGFVFQGAIVSVCMVSDDYCCLHSCQVSRNGRDSPSIYAHVPAVSRLVLMSHEFYKPWAWSCNDSICSYLEDALEPALDTTLNTSLSHPPRLLCVYYMLFT